jgi:hypothetical protein
MPIWAKKLQLGSAWPCVPVEAVVVVNGKRPVPEIAVGAAQSSLTGGTGGPLRVSVPEYVLPALKWPHSIKYCVPETAVHVTVDWVPQLSSEHPTAVTGGHVPASQTPITVSAVVEPHKEAVTLPETGEVQRNHTSVLQVAHAVDCAPVALTVVTGVVPKVLPMFCAVLQSSEPWARAAPAVNARAAKPSALKLARVRSTFVPRTCEREFWKGVMGILVSIDVRASQLPRSADRTSAQELLKNRG